MELSDRIAKSLPTRERELLTQDEGAPDFYGRLILIFEHGKFVRWEVSKSGLADAPLRKG